MRREAIHSVTTSLFSENCSLPQRNGGVLDLSEPRDSVMRD